MKKNNPIKSIRMYCVDFCMLGNSAEVRKCVSEKCPLFQLRFGGKPRGLQLITLKQIRKRCIDCYGGQIITVTKCEHPDCYLYSFRMGKNPYSKNKGNPQNLLYRKWPPTNKAFKEGDKKK